MFSIKEIIKATQGALLSGKGSIKIKGVSIDSRTAKPGDVFIAIKGEKFDGHDFIAQVIRKSAAALVVSESIKISDKRIPVIRVDDTTKALGSLARFHRDRFSIPVIAITGSAGKTTTKEMVAAVLKTQYKVLKNIATENNHVGVPLTLLRIKKSHEAVVVEFGTNHFGEIRRLTFIANPTAAILTNIGESHLGFLKNLQGVFREKYDLVESMRKPSSVLYNCDDPYLRKIKAKNSGHRLIRFGIHGECNYRAGSIEIKDNTFLQFKVNNARTFCLRTPAAHNVYNALAAVSCADLFKVRYKNIQKALQRFRFPPGRLSVQKFGSYHVIDDTYNANPISFRSAIGALNNFNTCGRKILVCADMLELGGESKRLHESIGNLVADSPLDCVVTVGRNSRFISQMAKKKNKKLEVHHCTSFEAAQNRLKNYLQPKDIILVKGSRDMHMERMVSFIKDLAEK